MLNAAGTPEYAAAAAMLRDLKKGRVYQIAKFSHRKYKATTLRRFGRVTAMHIFDNDLVHIVFEQTNYDGSTSYGRRAARRFSVSAQTLADEPIALETLHAADAELRVMNQTRRAQRAALRRARAL